MLVGILNDECIPDYFALSRNSPILLIQPPIVYLSGPDEATDKGVENLSREKNLSVTLRAVMFRNLYSTRSMIPGFYAACIPEDKNLSTSDLRRRLGVKTADEDFVFHFLIAHDGMRSQACRSYLRSLSNALASRTLTFNVSVADSMNPDHQTLFDNFNDDAVVEFQGARAIGHGLLS